MQDAYQVNENVGFHSLSLRNVQKEEERSNTLLLTPAFSPVLRKNKDSQSSPLLPILIRILVCLGLFLVYVSLSTARLVFESSSHALGSQKGRPSRSSVLS